MIEKIRNCYALVNNRSDFHNHMANVTGLKPESIQANWFGKKHMYVPKQWMERTLTELEHCLEQQKKEIQNALKTKVK